MSSHLLTEEAKAAFNGAFNVKFLATADSSGVPNIVPVISLMPDGDSRLLFGRLMLQKTWDNLNNGNMKIGFHVMDKKMNVWTGTGDFLGFKPAGREMDMLNSLEWMRYNAYTGFHSAGVIEIISIKKLGALSPLNILIDQKMTPGSSVIGKSVDRGVSPPGVLEKFLRLKAVKCAAVMSPEGVPVCLPCTAVGFSAIDSGIVKLAFSGASFKIKTGAQIAVSVITLDPIAYQIKGEVLSTAGKRIKIKVTRAYSASPPLPGEDLTAIRMGS